MKFIWWSFLVRREALKVSEFRPRNLRDVLGPTVLSGERGTPT